MKRILHLIDTAFPIFGVVIILASVLPDLDNGAVGGVIIGTLFIQAGISKMARFFLPNERKFLTLRAEGDLFLTLMRNLNTIAFTLKTEDTPENRREFEETKNAMQKSVERMAEMAGKTVEQIADDSGEPDAVVLWKNDFFGSPDVK